MDGVWHWFGALLGHAKRHLCCREFVLTNPAHIPDDSTACVWRIADFCGKSAIRHTHPEPGPVARTISYLQKAFGYKIATHSRYERGYEKLAIYADTNKVFKHVAKQSASKWLSKLGQLHDIEHSSLDVLVGPYGNVVRLLKRKRGRSGKK